MHLFCTEYQTTSDFSYQERNERRNKRPRFEGKARDGSFTGGYEANIQESTLTSLALSDVPQIS